MFKDKREQLFADLKGEDDYGVLLMVQMGGAPEELQLMIQTGEYDHDKQGLRPRRQYVVRALGVEEHQMQLGLFGALALTDDHPLLYQYNLPTVGFFFRGKPANAAELLLDIEQAHMLTFGFWRPFTDYIEVSQPLLTLLNSGGGLLGRMPRPLGERLTKVFDHHKLEHKLIEGDAQDMTDEHGRSRARKALIIDRSQIVALDFTIDELGKV
jgi:hypothetical protein